MSWSCWTWVLYSATIAATLREQCTWGGLQNASGRGIRRFWRHRGQRSRQQPAGRSVGISIGPRGKSWPGITSTISLFTARATGLDSKCTRSEEHTSELQSHLNLVFRLLLEKKKRHPVRVAPSQH